MRHAHIPPYTWAALFSYYHQGTPHHQKARTHQLLDTCPPRFQITILARAYVTTIEIVVSRSLAVGLGVARISGSTKHAAISMLNVARLLFLQAKKCMLMLIISVYPTIAIITGILIVLCVFESLGLCIRLMDMVPCSSARNRLFAKLIRRSKRENVNSRNRIMETGPLNPWIGPWVDIKKDVPAQTDFDSSQVTPSVLRRYARSGGSCLLSYNRLPSTSVVCSGPPLSVLLSLPPCGAWRVYKRTFTQSTLHGVHNNRFYPTAHRLVYFSMWA